MTPRVRITIASIVAAMLLALPARLFAHPMGNFSISHYAGITIGRGFLELRYLLDMAEIPTFQELQQTGLTARVDDPHLSPYLDAKAAELARGLHVAINGRPLELHLVSRAAIFPPGAGNLPTMKFGFVYRAEISDECSVAPCDLAYDDANFPDRAGWKEIIATAGENVALASSTAPTKDRSAQLSNYPTDLLNSPPQDLRAKVVFSFQGDGQPATSQAPAGASVPPPFAAAPATSAGAAQAQAAQTSNQPTAAPVNPTGVSSAPALGMDVKPNQQATPRSAFTELMGAKEISFSVAWLAALIAVGLGALHALEPGHGKTIVAAYLVGAKGTAYHAVLLGLIVTLSHTAGVYLLGAITLYAQKYVVPDQLYPVLGVLSGVLIAGMGFYLFLQRYGGPLAHGHTHSHGHGPFGHTHSHDHGEHFHSHGSLEHTHDHHHAHGPDTHEHSHDLLSHSHARPHEHSHEVAIAVSTPALSPAKKPSITQLLVLGITGGIVPCPAALVVLLSAVALHRVGFGLFLIVAFSVGLAAVLIAMGLAAVYAGRLMSRIPADGVVIQRWLPLTSAAMITVLGCVIAVRGLIAAGIVQIRL